jgi:hypothetical protein
MILLFEERALFYKIQYILKKLSFPNLNLTDSLEERIHPMIPARSFLKRLNITVGWIRNFATKIVFVFSELFI